MFVVNCVMWDVGRVGKVLGNGSAVLERTVIYVDILYIILHCTEESCVVAPHHIERMSHYFIITLVVPFGGSELREWTTPIGRSWRWLISEMHVPAFTMTRQTISHCRENEMGHNSDTVVFIIYHHKQTNTQRDIHIIVIVDLHYGYGCDSPRKKLLETTK